MHLCQNDQDSAYNKRQFFQDVLNGKISFDETKISIKNIGKVLCGW